MDKINTAQPTIDQDNRRYVESTRVYCAIYRQERATWNACSSGIAVSPSCCVKPCIPPPLRLGELCKTLLEEV